MERNVNNITGNNTQSLLGTQSAECADILYQSESGLYAGTAVKDLLMPALTGLAVPLLIAAIAAALYCGFACISPMSLLIKFGGLLV